jgi:hypothetical protein
VKCLSESAPKASTLRLQFPFLLGLFFAVNYSLELITFFFLFIVVFIFFLPFNSCLPYWCHFRDCLFLLTFSVLSDVGLSLTFLLVCQKKGNLFTFLLFINSYCWITEVFITVNVEILKQISTILSSDSTERTLHKDFLNSVLHMQINKSKFTFLL